MNKMIKNLSSKLTKLEMETKNSPSKNFQNDPNRGYNPQNRKPPLQILQRERKEQPNQVPHPLYLEGQVDCPTEDVTYEGEEAYLAYASSDEVECPLHAVEAGEVSAQEKADESTEDPEINDYCKQFVDFMQAKFNKKYDLRSSRKRTCTQDEEEDTPQKPAPVQEEMAQRTPDEGKRPLDQPLQSDTQRPTASQVTASPNVKPIVKEVKPPLQSKYAKEKEL